MSELLIGKEECSLTRREQLILDPMPMLLLFEQLLDETVVYRRAEGVRKGIESHDPSALNAFKRYYHGNAAELEDTIERSWTRCLRIAQRLANKYAILGQEITPEALVVGVIQKKPAIRRRIKRLKEQNNVPSLITLGLA
ncbi:hypothetical protein IKG20_01860 [Candidatus Saccharibacteria bacterium]|nr:hypothetical protein [Candidatus Saccharibacteria bacterium]